METEIYRFLGDSKEYSAAEEEALKRAGKILLEGGLVAFPTETVYGLGGDALNRNSSKKIYLAKGRPSDNPLIVHISKLEDLYEIAKEVPGKALAVADAFWPGPMTMILKKSDKVPYETTGGLDTVAVRFPSHPLAQKLIAYGGGFVAAPSANLSGKPSPTLAKYVEEDMMGRIDMILDGGKEVGIGLESTIVDMTIDPPQILRPGYVTEEMLKKVLGEVEMDRTILDHTSKQAPRAPGMKYRHYAPTGELTIVKGSASRVVEYINRQIGEASQKGQRTGVIATQETQGNYRADVVMSVGRRDCEEEIAKNLYDVLRRCDEEKLQVIYAECFSDTGLGQAIMNRLQKAAGHRIIILQEDEK